MKCLDSLKLQTCIAENGMRNTGATDDTARSSVLNPMLKERLCEILNLSYLNEINRARLGE